LGCQILGAEVAGSTRREFGRAPVRILDADSVLAGVPRETIVWMSHADQVRSATGDFDTLAAPDTCPLATVKHRPRPFCALQFHPEVSHTPEGGRILRNFLHDVCGCHGLWKMQTFIDRTVADVRERVGKSRVICGLSGGVDSSVVAALLLRAIGKQVACIFVDNGLLREGEAESVKHTFRDWFQADLHVVDASARFLAALKGVTEPQEKRKRIGHVFIDVFREEARSIPDARFLAQGTLYPDVIESG